MDPCRSNIGGSWPLWPLRRWRLCFVLSFAQSNTGVLSLLIADQKSATLHCRCNLELDGSNVVTLHHHAVKDFIWPYSGYTNPKVKELLKSVHICQRYCKNKSGTFVWPTVYLAAKQSHIWRHHHCTVLLQDAKFLYLRQFLSVSQSVCHIRDLCQTAKRIKHFTATVFSCQWNKLRPCRITVSRSVVRSSNFPGI